MRPDEAGQADGLSCEFLDLWRISYIDLPPCFNDFPIGW